MEKKWWHDKVVYQIYPKSFKDSNNDGIGDIKGILSKLDYLKKIGVDILWITPFFKSPMEDNGYDVADYYSINPLFGTMEDMDLLIEECNKRNMYIMMDIVANHTSSKHDWFIQSKKSKDNKYRDYYIWRDSKLHDMQSCFSGSAWEYDENTKQYYFHEFGKGQPDLNWENDKIVEEVANIINFWLEKGIRGIRFDVIHLIGKEIDNNILAYGPTLHSKIKKLNNLSFGKYDAITVGEAWGTLQNAIDFTTPSNEELSMVFQFEATAYTAMYTPYGKFSPRKINMKDIKNILIKYQNGLNDISWNALVVENHDLGRAINRFGSLNYKEKSAKEIAIMNYFLKGTPYIYQGQEIGMINKKVHDIKEYDDLEIHGAYKELVLEKKVLSYEDFMDACYKEGRDNNRFPFQWDNLKNGGFSTADKCWLEINPVYETINVENELKDSNSILNFYIKLINIRKNTIYSNTIINGRFNNIDTNDNVFIYTRNLDKNICIVCNMNQFVEEVILPYDIKNIILSNTDSKIKGRNITLQPYDAFVFDY